LSRRIRSLVGICELQWSDWSKNRRQCNDGDVVLLDWSCRSCGARNKC
jgi:hypothetical protein